MVIQVLRCSCCYILVFGLDGRLSGPQRPQRSERGSRDTWSAALQTGQHDARILDGRLHLAQEHDRLTAIDQTMVVRQGDVHHRPNNHLALDRHRSLKDAVHTENGALRRIDDRCAHQRAEHTTVADGERTAVHILDGDRVALRLLAERRNGDLNVGEVLAFAVAQHRHNETLGRGHRNGDVDVVAVDDLLPRRTERALRLIQVCGQIFDCVDASKLTPSSMTALTTG